uniref:Uncharacterized protein n=1 Tax=Geobacter sp. (strain M21) TaxID=443144 RepID=C6E589_GEOSM
MKSVQQDVMYDVIAQMKFGMTVAEAGIKGICINCKRVVSFKDSTYEQFAFCSDCLVRTNDDGLSSIETERTNET